jgi:hypothetical protein
VVEFRGPPGLHRSDAPLTISFLRGSKLASLLKYACLLGPRVDVGSG